MANKNQSFSANEGRRSFVKNAALFTGSALFIPSALAARVHLDGDDSIKVALIGCGGRGTGAAAQALSTAQNVKLVAMADAFRDRIDSSLKYLLSGDAGSGDVDITTRIDVPEEHKFTGFDAYKKAIPLADVVILTTPPGFRPLHFEEAVRQGKHVFMEKPVATDAPGVRRVLAAAEEAKNKKLNVVVGLQRHYEVKYSRWVEMIHTGAIGDILSGRVYWNGNGVWVKKRAELEKNAGRQLTEMEYQMRNWYYFTWLCGDHICEQHIHNIDVANWVKGGHPVKAQGMGGRQVRIGPDYGEIFDHHFVEFQYEDGSRIYSQCRHQPGTFVAVTEGFQGSNGSAPRPGQLISRSGNEIYNHNDSNDPNPYQVEHDMLFEAVAKGNYRYADAENGAIATMTAIMGRMATYSGKEIDWDTALNSPLNLHPDSYTWDTLPKVLPGEDALYPCAIPGVTQAW